MNVDDGNNKTADNSVRRSSIRHNTDGQSKNVVWDWKSLEEQEQERKLNPKKKINEPKTPYQAYEEEDDEYLSRLNEVNKTKPTAELLEQVAHELKRDNLQEDIETGMDVEVVDKDGNVVIERNVKMDPEEEEKKKKEFLQKRKQAYANEFTMARKFQQNKDEDDDEEEIVNETMKNTLYNKFAGKLSKEIKK